MAIDPYDGNFSAKSLQAQIDALKASQLANSSADISSRMREVQAASAYESMMRMQQAQQSMLRNMQQANLQLAANQSPFGQMAYGSFVAMPGAIRPTNVFAGRNIGYTATGASTQSIGGIISDAGLAASLNYLTRGIAFKGWSQSIGASRAQVMETARDELRTRIDDFGRNTFASLHPEWLNRRIGTQFSELDGDFARQITASFSNIRNPSALGLRADGVGLRMNSATPRLLTSQTMRGIRQLDRERGFSLTDEDATSIAGMVSDTLAMDTGMQATAMSGPTGSNKVVNQLLSAFSSLERSLQANATEVRRLSLEGLKMGLTPEQITKLGETVGRMTFNSQFSNAQEATVMMGLRREGISGYYGNGDRYAVLQRNQAEAIKNQLLSQGRGTELFRYGGENATEAGLLYQGRIAARGEQWLQNNAGSLGVLAARGQMPSSFSDLGNQLGQVYSADPFAMINMMADPEARLDAVTNAEIASYQFGKMAGKQMPQHARAIAIQSIARQNGVSIPEAAEIYRRYQAREGSLALMSNNMGVSVDSMLFTAAKYDRAGLALPAISSSGLAKAVQSGSLVDMVMAYDSADIGGIGAKMIKSRTSSLLSVKELQDLTPTELVKYLEKEVNAGKISVEQAKELIPSLQVSDVDGMTRLSIDTVGFNLSEQARISSEYVAAGRGGWIGAVIDGMNEKASSAFNALHWSVGDSGPIGSKIAGWSAITGDGALRDKTLLRKSVEGLTDDTEEQRRIMDSIVSILNQDAGAPVSIEDLNGVGALDSRATKDELIKTNVFIDAYRAMNKVNNPPPTRVYIAGIDETVATELRR